MIWNTRKGLDTAKILFSVSLRQLFWDIFWRLVTFSYLKHLYSSFNRRSRVKNATIVQESWKQAKYLITELLDAIRQNFFYLQCTFTHYCQYFAVIFRNRAGCHLIDSLPFQIRSNWGGCFDIHQVWIQLDCKKSVTSLQPYDNESFESVCVLNCYSSVCFLNALQQIWLRNF